MMRSGVAQRSLTSISLQQQQQRSPARIVVAFRSITISSSASAPAPPRPQLNNSSVLAAGLATLGLLLGTAAIAYAAPRESLKMTSSSPLSPSPLAPVSELSAVTSSTSPAGSTSLSEATPSDAIAAISDTTPLASESEEHDPSQSAAYNPITGEINWACPCLGGMADGPCGPEFKEAFSCFIYSEEEIKGVECVEKFRGMQDCFRKHPEIYGAEIEEEEQETAELESQAQAYLAMSDDEFLADAAPAVSMSEGIAA